MTQKRIIILIDPNDLTMGDWAIVSDQGTLIKTVMQGKLDQLPAETKNLNVYIIAPAHDVLLTQASLPKLNRQRLLQALPYALEEQLIDDVGNLHFAIGEYQTDGTLPVAVVSKEKMQQWIHALKTADIEPLAIIPSTLAIPCSENNGVVYTYDDISVVRTGKYSGFATDSFTLKNMLELSASTLQNITINKKALLEKIALEITSLPYINLLQKPYTSKRKTTKTKNVWKIAAYLATAWVSVVLINDFISLLILHHQSSVIQAKIDKIYYHHFPQAKNLTAPRERMESKLKEITSASQKNNFLSLLATVGKGLTQTGGIRLQNLDYRNGLLTLEVSSATFDNLDSLTRNLNAQGLAVKQQNSATSGTQVKATLLINAGAA